jgi:cAMP phosphodiesterase
LIKFFNYTQPQFRNKYTGIYTTCYVIKIMRKQLHNKILWCSGYHICLTHRRSQVRALVRSFLRKLTIFFLEKQSYGMLKLGKDLILAQLDLFYLS